MKVLIIEDHALDRKLVGAVLRTDGHSVRDGSSAAEGLQAVHSDPPDVILLDLRLPGMDGLTLARQLKADPATSGIPIVALTAYPERYPRQSLLDAGCAACIVKPVDTRALCRQIEQALGRPCTQRADES
jgi:CheY-like chemotaxis protein